MIPKNFLSRNSRSPMLLGLRQANSFGTKNLFSRTFSKGFLFLLLPSSSTSFPPFILISPPSFIFLGGKSPETRPPKPEPEKSFEGFMKDLWKQSNSGQPPPKVKVKVISGPQFDPNSFRGLLPYILLGGAAWGFYFSSRGGSSKQITFQEFKASPPRSRSSSFSSSLLHFSLLLFSAALLSLPFLLFHHPFLLFLAEQHLGKGRG